MPSRRPRAAEAARLWSMLHFERQLCAAGVRFVAGIDEAGAGPLAGPVVAAAVVLPRATSVAGIDDSKQLSQKARETLAEVIERTAVARCVAQASEAEIDAYTIRQACLLAMRRALLGVAARLGADATAADGLHALVDAHTLDRLPCRQTALIGGDGRSQSIAAASILAKVHRDALMRRLDVEYPGYGFAAHKGYGTAVHLAALQRLGPCPVHRRSFAPVRRLPLPFAACPEDGPADPQHGGSQANGKADQQKKRRRAAAPVDRLAP